MMPRFGDRPRIRMRMEEFHRVRRERSRKFEEQSETPQDISGVLRQFGFSFEKMVRAEPHAPNHDQWRWKGSQVTVTVESSGRYQVFDADSGRELGNGDTASELREDLLDAVDDGYIESLKREQAGVLRIGDKVTWRGGWGARLPMDAKVTHIEIVPPGEKEGGVSVTEIPWDRKDEIVVDLDNGHWAYGYQIEPMT